MWQSNHPLFKSLTDQEELEFREYARDIDPPEGTSWEILHPVCREKGFRRGLYPKVSGGKPC